MKQPHIDHIGIIVDDMDRSLTLFEDLFRMSPAKRTEIADTGLKIATLQAANIEIELIQYTGGDQGFAREVMGLRKGINHFSVRVDDVGAALKEFEKKGVRVMDGFPRQGSHGEVAFFRPETTQDILLEICGNPREEA